MIPAEDQLCSAISKPQLQPQACGGGSVNIPTNRYFVSTWPNASKWFEKVLNTKSSKNVFPKREISLKIAFYESVCPLAQLVKNLPAMQETRVRSLG